MHWRWVVPIGKYECFMFRKDCIVAYITLLFPAEKDPAEFYTQGAIVEML